MCRDDQLKKVCKGWNVDKFMLWARSWNEKKIDYVIQNWPHKHIARVLEHRFLAPKTLDALLRSWKTLELTDVLVHCSAKFIHRAIGVVYYDEERWSDEDVSNLVGRLSVRRAAGLLVEYDSDEAAYFLQNLREDQIGKILKASADDVWSVQTKSKLTTLRFDSQWGKFFGNADLSMEGLRKLFDKIDADESGTLSVDEIADAMSKLSGNKKSIRTMMQPYLEDGDDGNRFVSFSGFVKIVRDMQQRLFRRKAFRKWMHFLSGLDCDSVESDTLSEVFNDLDLDHSGSLNRDELKAILGDASNDEDDGNAAKTGGNGGLLAHIIAEADTDGDDEVSFDEFCALIRTYKKRRRGSPI